MARIRNEFSLVYIHRLFDLRIGSHNLGASVEVRPGEEAPLVAALDSDIFIGVAAP